MKVGMFGTFVTLWRGGGEQYALCLGRELTRRGHRVGLICGRSLLRPSLRIPDEHLFEVRARPYLVEIRELSRFAPPSLASALYALSRRFHQWAVRRDFAGWDVIHVGTVETAEAALRGREGRQPVVLTVHGPVPPVDRRLVAALDAVVPTGHRVAQQIERELGVSCRVIPAGLDLPRFFPMEREKARARLGVRGGPRALFVGRLLPIKNIETLLQAFLALTASLPGLELTLIGDGVGRRRLEALSGRLGVGARVHFVGAQEQDVLPLYYNAADVVVLPSHYESFGQVALEALACGRPLVVSDGVTEILHRFPEVPSFPKDDPAALAAVVREAIKNPPPPLARERLAPFDWPEIARQYSDLYDELVARRAA